MSDLWCGFVSWIGWSDYSSCVGVMRPQKINTPVGAGCSDEPRLMGVMDSVGADVPGGTDDGEVPWLDAGGRPPIEVKDTGPADTGPADAGVTPPREDAAGDGGEPPKDVIVPPEDAVGTDGEDAVVPPADATGTDAADVVVPLPADATGTDAADAVVPLPADATGTDAADAVVPPPADAAGADAATDAAGEVDAGGTVPAGYVPPAVVIPGYLQPDTVFWLGALPQVWDTCFKAQNGYLTPFVDSQGQQGLVVTDPISGNITSEGVSYGMKGAAGTALMLATFGTLQNGDFQKAVDLQADFNKLLRGYKEMQVLGNGLGAWNVVVQNGTMALNAGVPGAANSASDADIDVYMALKMAARLVQIGIWQVGTDYDQEAANIAVVISQNEVKSLGGRFIFAPSEDYYCDDQWPWPAGTCPAVLVNPAYNRVLAFALAGDVSAELAQLSADAMDLYAAILQVTVDKVPDWARVAVGQDGSFIVSPSVTKPGGFAMSYDGVRWPLAIRGGVASDTVAQQMLLGQTPASLAQNWGLGSITPDIVAAMGYLGAVSTQNAGILGPYSQALKDEYGAHPGTFSASGVGAYYANSLGMLAGIDAYLIYLLGL